MLKQFSLFKLCQPTTCILAQQRRNIIRLGCFAVILYQGNPKPLKRQVHRKKTGFYHVLSKNRGFLNSKISISALSHKVLPLMLKNQQCSYQHAASGLVSCRARDFCWETIPTFLKCMPYNFPSTKCSDKQCHFLHTRSIHNNLNCVFAKQHFTMSKRPVFLMKFVRAKTISGP